MQDNQALKFAPVITEEQKIDVTLRGGEAEIRLSMWEENLGWCPQKTMVLDASMVDELHRVLTAARMKLKRESVDRGEQIIPAKILEFPKFA